MSNDAIVADSIVTVFSRVSLVGPHIGGPTPELVRVKHVFLRVSEVDSRHKKPWITVISHVISHNCEITCDVELHLRTTSYVIGRL